MAIRQECSPGEAQTVSEPALNDPFTMNDGTAVSTLAQMTCRQQEISAMAQQFELGEKPGAPAEVTASFSDGELSVTCSDGAGASIDFSVTIEAPSGGGEGQGQGPHPAIIAYGAPSIPIPDGVATITFSNDDIAAQQDTGSRGQGKFYDLYPYGSGGSDDHSSGAMAAWAWGVSRILDALEATPDANIDTARVGVTGCSRNGKGAMMAGALEERLALTIPQESGAGGAACWRLSDDASSRGDDVQTASQIVTENVWFSSGFEQYVDDVGSLPVDHHMIAGLVSPRGMLVIENDIDWLGPWSCYGCMSTARKVYQAMGAADSMGFSQQGGHDHCQFPSGQQEDLDAFINRFLLGQDADTDIFKTDGSFDWNEADWVSWSVPELS